MFKWRFWTRGRAIDLLLFSRASVSGPENVAGSSFSAHVVVFKPCKMLQSRDIVHPGCKIEVTLELLLLLLLPPPPPGEDSSRNSGAEENSAFENSNFALINAISVTVIMDQISG